MSAGVEETREMPREIPPLKWKVNWWGILGLLCMAASAFLSVGILFEVLQFLKAAGLLEALPFLG